MCGAEYNFLESLGVDLSTSEDHLNKLIREWVHIKTRLSKTFDIGGM